MAIGLGRIMGYDFPENFNHPYRASSFSDFWARWHISLSTWLRDYLYIPLGGNRQGTWRTMLNLMLTMLLGGLWHGASWLFLLWGGLHGMALILQRICGSLGPRTIQKNCPCWVKTGVVFFLVTCMWVPFRASRFIDIGEFWSAIFRWEITDALHWFYNNPENALLLMLCTGLHFCRGSFAKTIKWSSWPLLLRTVVWASLLFWLLNFYPQNSSVQPFIYFQF